MALLVLRLLTHCFLFFFVLLLSCFSFYLYFCCFFVSVRSVHQAIHAELDSLRIKREAYNMRVGKDKRRLYTLHRPIRELRERERERDVRTRLAGTI